MQIAAIERNKSRQACSGARRRRCQTAVPAGFAPAQGTLRCGVRRRGGPAPGTLAGHGAASLRSCSFPLAWTEQFSGARIGKSVCFRPRLRAAFGAAAAETRYFRKHRQCGIRKTCPVVSTVSISTLCVNARDNFIRAFASRGWSEVPKAESNNCSFSALEFVCKVSAD